MEFVVESCHSKGASVGAHIQIKWSMKEIKDELDFVTQTIFVLCCYASTLVQDKQKLGASGRKVHL